MRPEELERWIAEAKRIGGVGEPAATVRQQLLILTGDGQLAAAAGPVAAGIALMNANNQPHRALIQINFDGAKLSSLVSLDGIFRW
jgi:hypothetical protein